MRVVGALSWSVDGIGRDVRFATRVLTREPWFTGGAVVALALGLAVAIMTATIINGYYYSGLPTADAQNVVHVGTRDSAGRARGVSRADYENWRRASRSFAEMGAFAGVSVIADPGVSPDSQGGAYVSASAFRVLGAVPMLGRAFAAADDRPGAAAVVILGHRLWTMRYGADAGVLGRTVSIDGTSATVIGVMAEGFEFPFREALWLPLGSMPNIDTESRGEPVLGVVGRLTRGVSPMQARAELQAVAAAVPAAPSDRTIEPVVVRFGEQQVGRLGDQEPPLALIATATLVLLIACGNVANLLLARSAGRAREIALRVSVGATRWRVVRQLLVENLMIALAAGALGLWLSRFGVHFIADGFGRNAPYWMRFDVDGRIVLGLASLCALTTIAFGLAPALIASKSRAIDLVREGAARVPRSRRLTNVLLATEFALTVTLLACGGLMLRSFVALYQSDRLIDASRLVTVQVTVDLLRHPPERRAAFFAALDERLATVPGVHTAVASHRPFVGARRRALAFADRPQPRAGEEPPRVPVVAIGLRYFDVLAVRLIHGRSFTGLDGAPGHEAAIVNEGFVNRYFPEGSPLGHRIRLTDITPDSAPSAWITIVGLAPTIRQAIAAEAGPVVYLPIRTYAADGAALIAGHADNPATLVPALRRAVASFDDRLTLHNVRPLSELRDDSRLQHRLIGTVLAAFAAVALLLSTVGLYGVTAYSVLLRRHEIGVRVAIGARPAQVVWLFVRRSMMPLATGGVIGLFGAFAAGRLLQGALIQTSPIDPVTLAAIVVLLLGTGLTASFVPSRRAARLDPLVVLRSE